MKGIVDFRGQEDHKLGRTHDSRWCLAEMCLVSENFTSNGLQWDEVMLV